MNFSAWAIKKPIPSIVLFILATLAGLIAFNKSYIQDFPDVELPIVIVNTAMPGASPAQLENDVARKIENALAGLSEVRHIYSHMENGMVTTTVEFRLEKDNAVAMSDVRDALSQVRADLPAEVRDPVLSKFSFSGIPVITYTVSSDKLDEEALSWYVDNQVTKSLLALKGVGRVNRTGGLSREVLIELDPQQMAALNVSAADVSRQLQRVQQEAPGGKADINGAKQSVRTIATVGQASELAKLELSLSDGRKVRLEQIAAIKDGAAERTSLALLDGKPVVGFEIARSKGASEVTVANAVRAAVAELSRQDPSVKISEVYNISDAVKENYDGSMYLLYEGSLLAVIVVWLFLRDWRATFVSATALPLSIIPTFAAMYLFDFSLNTVTLIALALVIGILVDDAIVEIENIVRHLRMGKTPLQAALEAADEIGLAVVATTFALIAVFLPTAFMSGIIGKFFKQFGWTASVAVAASLVVARLLTPMMAAYILKPINHQVQDGPMMRVYLRMAHWCLQHRGLTMLFSILFFIGSVSLVGLLPQGFVPPADRAQTALTIELPPGSTLEQTRTSAEQARALLMQDPDVTKIYSVIGGGDGRKATLNISLKHRTERARKQGEVERDLRKLVANLPATRMTLGSGDSGEMLIIILSSDESQALLDTSQQVLRDLRTLPGVGNVSSDASLMQPEVVITPDPAKAADLGVTAAAIGDTVRVATAGDYDQVLPKLNLPERQIPIRVRLPESYRTDLAALGRLQVPGGKGNVMLANVADLRIDSGPAAIDRMDRHRIVTLKVELNGLQLGEVLEKANALPSLKNLPPAVKRQESGDAESLNELFSGFALAMGTGVLCVYLVLVLLFHSFLQPVTILAALPLSFGGAFLALLATHNAMSMPSLIGILMLMGIAVKNSILLVEYAIVARRDLGMSRMEALMDACHKRAQPIVMTSIAMAAGMLPIALGFGADPSFRSPMAIAVIGGLITSTFLSLLVIPVVYCLVDDMYQFATKGRKKKNAGTDKETASVNLVKQ